MWETFANCGWASWLILLCAMGTIGTVFLSLVFSLWKQPKMGLGFAVLALLLSMGAIASGPAGMMSGRRKVEQAVSGESVDPAQKARIIALGYEEASCCVTVGMGLGTPALILAVGSLAIGAIMLKKKTAKLPSA